MAKILIIEDNLTMLKLLKTLMTLEGYQVLTATDKGTIFQTLSQETPDLILLDVHLRADDGTEISGYEILEHIRRTPELRNTRVIMTSGIDLRERALKAGADDFVLKPYIPDELMDSIQLHLSE